MLKDGKWWYHKTRHRYCARWRPVVVVRSFWHHNTSAVLLPFTFYFSFSDAVADSQCEQRKATFILWIEVYMKHASWWLFDTSAPAILRIHTHSLRITHISAWSMYVEAHKRMNKLLNNDFEYAMSENSPYAHVDVRTVNGYFWRCIDQKNICAFIMFEWRYNIEIYVRCALSNVQRYYFYGMSIEHVCLRFL